MIGREMRVALDHHRRFPAAEPLQLVRRCTGLAMPRCPGVPQIVPAEVLDTGTLQSIPPGIERHGNRTAILRLIRAYPSMPALEIDARPFQPHDIRLPQA